ncbi:hypothetical protein LOD99_5590 [Oopsacas minuta]|uniref:Uncharacterized protein n=1 Tax=Oopsacas minuta TaxID=111878 RepID=A0AAV7JPU7_9METZ|nr:hypothetical protein LOD99_5590 [Oopsacas minuta]
MEYSIAKDELVPRNVDDIEEKCKEMEDWYALVEDSVTTTFEELSFLYRDARSLKYLARKNKEDKDLKEIYEIVLRYIRHYYNNRKIFLHLPSPLVTTQW